MGREGEEGSFEKFLGMNIYIFLFLIALFVMYMYLQFHNLECYGTYLVKGRYLTIFGQSS